MLWEVPDDGIKVGLAPDDEDVEVGLRLVWHAPDVGSGLTWHALGEFPMAWLQLVKLLTFWCSSAVPLTFSRSEEPGSVAIGYN